jgi:hypothetical protein
MKLAHNLDLMHIEKNICENLIGTLLKITRKTKNTINARVELEKMGITSNLHMMAEAPYVLLRTGASDDRWMVVHW